MKSTLFAISVVAISLMTGSSPVLAFTQEPIPGATGGNDGGNRFLNPDADVPRLADQVPGRDGPRGRNQSPFSFSVTGPGLQDGPNVHRSNDENRYLYWNNTTNRHETYDRNSTSSRYPSRR
jgi:hypothetical protein